MKSFMSTIEKYGMLPPKSGVIACVSGGADSMALLSLLLKYKHQLKLSRLCAFHLNHGLRGAESDADEKLVADYCRQNGVELFIERAEMSTKQKPQGSSLEEWARELRYGFFKDYSERTHCLIATAHTLNDRAETLLFQLSRGSGLSGAKSIPPVRGNIIRPLINTSRNEIEEYCRENNIAYAVDSTNASLDYSRNLIRHTVIPRLLEINGGALRNMAGFSDRCEQAQDFIRASAELVLKKAESCGKYDASTLNDCHIAVKYEAITLMLSDICSLDSARAKLCEEALEADGAVQITEGVRFVVRAGKAFVETKTGALDDYRMPAKPGINLLPCGLELELLKINEFTPKSIDNIEKSSLNNTIDCGKIKGNIYFRSRKPGETFKGLAYQHTRPVKKILNELRIEPDKRPFYPILADDEGAIWIMGVGVALRVAAGPRTRKAFEIIKF